MSRGGALPTSSDEELMALYAAGDRTAFDVLFGRYVQLVTGIARRYAASADDAQDLVQQTFLNLHRARHDFRAERPLRPWLAAIALNVAREHGRRRSRRPEAPLPSELSSAAGGPAVAAAARDERRRVRLALEGLTDAQREVIELHWFAGLSFPEVAQAVGAGLSAVKVRAHRGYARLRQALTGP